MNPLRDQEQIDEMRKRLYSRGGNEDTFVRHDLTDKKIDVARDWNTAPSKEEPTTEPVVSEEKKSRRYRSIILVGSLAIFIIVALVSSIYLYFGGNQISSSNISINIEGPSTIGGGETISLQIGLTNQNSTAIDSATLIVKYPPGTRTIQEPIKTLNEERIQIDSVEPGEVRNIPLQVAIYGEEGDQKQIEATLEYRISGSNGVFYKDSEPLKFQIITSPLVLKVTSVKKVASGQTVDLIVTAKSNATTPLFNVLVSATYPNGFSYQESSPSPIYAENVWQIDELKPEETFEIKLKGVVSGLTNEASRITFNAGPAQPDNRYIVGATLAEVYSEFTIESPFIDIDISINSDDDLAVIIPEGQNAAVDIAIANTLDETVYDMVVEIVPGGNALNDNSINTNGGFYDSNTGVIRFEVSNNPSFARVLPGDSRRLTFTVSPGNITSTASFDLAVNVYARRVAESSAQEQLLGTAKASAKYTSKVKATSQIAHISGPVPPKTGETTEYTATVVAKAGVNNLSDTIITTSLPSYVDWLDNYSADVGGSVIYNPVSKKIEWKAGSIDTGQEKRLIFSVGLLPSNTQVGITPVLVNDQLLVAIDSFTGIEVKTELQSLTTELSREAGFPRGNGEVIRN